MFAAHRQDDVALSPRRLLLALALVVALGAGCRVEIEVGIDVDEDGSGVVTVGLGVDDEVLEALPGLLEQQLRVDDLTAAGWTVGEPAREADGLTWVRLSKPFGTPDEAGQILAEVSGGTGPFRDFRVARDRSFARTEFDFEGTVDFAAGLEDFTDERLADSLDGEPLGDDIEAIEEQLGATADEVFGFRVAVRLPGDVESNAPTQAANGAVWQPRLSEDGPILLTASSSSLRTSTVVLTIVTFLAALAAVVVLVLTFLRPRRRRQADAG